jgi:hypothetical protein
MRISGKRVCQIGDCGNSYKVRVLSLCWFLGQFGGKIQLNSSLNWQAYSCEVGGKCSADYAVCGCGKRAGSASK